MRAARSSLLLAPAAFLLLLPARTPAQESAPPEPPPPVSQVTFEYERPGLQVPHFTLRVDEQGQGSYVAELVSSASPSIGDPAEPPPIQTIDRSIALSGPTVKRIFAAALSLDRFNIPCASQLKNIADSGKKTFRYAGPGGDGACTFNFSENKTVLELATIFQGIAFTLDLGRKMDFDRRFDRLGLDSDMKALTDAVVQGQALELGNIARTLRLIAEDTEVIERVRLRASDLLTRFPPAG